jgi:hypothetical protein
MRRRLAVGGSIRFGSRSSRGPGHRPLTAATPVRIRYGTPLILLDILNPRPLLPNFLPYRCPGILIVLARFLMVRRRPNVSDECSIANANSNQRTISAAGSSRLTQWSVRRLRRWWLAVQCSCRTIHLPLRMLASNREFAVQPSGLPETSTTYCRPRRMRWKQGSHGRPARILAPRRDWATGENGAARICRLAGTPIRPICATC